MTDQIHFEKVAATGFLLFAGQVSVFNTKACEMPILFSLAKPA